MTQAEADVCPVDKALASYQIPVGSKLDGADFSCRLLIGAVFRNCSLRDCDFSNTDLSYALFIDCDLYRCRFSHAVLYAARFKNCDATKADFRDAYLSGVRFVSLDVTHTEFDVVPKLGSARKNQVSVADRKTTHKFGEKIASISELEKSVRRIDIAGQKPIELYRTEPQDSWRRWRRQAEVCKIIKRVLMENGYFDKALDYYYSERLCLRRSKHSSLERAWDFVVGQIGSGYGVRWKNPVLCYLSATVIFAAIYWLLPSLLGSQNGIVAPEGANLAPSVITSFGDCMFFSLLNSVLHNLGGTYPVGVAKVISAVQVMMSVVLVALAISAFSKRSANI